MKLQFFSSTLLAISAILSIHSPTQAAVNSGSAPPKVQASQKVPEKSNIARSLRLAQAQTTQPVDFPILDNNSNNFPFFCRNGDILFPVDYIPELYDPVTIDTETAMTLQHRLKDAAAGHTEQYANYKTWDGSDWTASIDLTGQFTHTLKGAGSSHADTVINYISWDGRAWSATIDPVSKVFTHTQRETGASHTDTILNYVAWDGSQWTMSLQ